MRCRALAAVAALSLLAGCVTAQTDAVSLQPKPHQQLVERESGTSLASRQQYSIVLLRPVHTVVAPEAHPEFFVAIENVSRRPFDFKLAQNVAVTQIADNKELPLKVYAAADEEPAAAAPAPAKKPAGRGPRGRSSNMLTVGGMTVDGLETLGSLERGALHDGRLVPGKWFGGKMQIDRPAGEGRKPYTIVVMVGPDRHEFDLVQEPLAH